MLPKTSAANSRGSGGSLRSGKTAAGWESVQGTAKREASCHYQPTPPPGRKNPAIVLYQADEFIKFLLRHRLLFFDCEGGDVMTQVVANAGPNTTAVNCCESRLNYVRLLQGPQNIYQHTALRF
jgi:hypothetical protein